MNLIHSLRGRFTLGVIVITLLLSLIPLLGGRWLAQLDRTLAQVSEQTAPASSLAAQSAHISAQLIGEIHHLTLAQDQYTRQNTHFGITQRATLLLSHIRDLEAATGVTQTSTVMAETATEILVIVDTLNRDIAQMLELAATDEQVMSLRSSLAVKEQQLSRLSRLLSTHCP